MKALRWIWNWVFVSTFLAINQEWWDFWDEGRIGCYSFVLLVLGFGLGFAIIFWRLAGPPA